MNQPLSKLSGCVLLAVEVLRGCSKVAIASHSELVSHGSTVCSVEVCN